MLQQSEQLIVKADDLVSGNNAKQMLSWKQCSVKNMKMTQSCNKNYLSNNATVIANVG